MASASAPPFVPPAIPWRQPQALPAVIDLGPGLDPVQLSNALQRLCAEPGLLAVVVFGSRGRGDARSSSDLDLAVIVAEPTLTPQDKAACWSRCRERIGPLGVGVDLIVAGAADAERLSQSRWHVLGDVARFGRVLYVAS
jgi:predicted nucleotidyltransferase